MRRRLTAPLVTFGIAAAAVCVTVPSAQAQSARARPADTIGSCFSEAVNSLTGEIECSAAGSFAVTPDTWTYTVESGWNGQTFTTSYTYPVSKSPYLDFPCGKGTRFEIGIIITDSIGDTESGWLPASCRTGIPPR